MQSEFIGPYRIGRTLGSGSFGKVKQGTNPWNNQQVAIKSIPIAKKDQRVEREIQILKLLNHPNIVGLHDVLEVNGNINLIMELVNGGELFDHIVQKKRLREDEARTFFRQMVSALEYCHGNLVVHRDLKLENILLTEDGQIKIADFGFSNIVLPGHLFNTFCGSPMYSAPELFLGKDYLGPPVDIWSLGVILYAMVCGSLPFGKYKDDFSLLVRRVCDGDFDVPSWLSTPCVDLILRLLNPNPDERLKITQVKHHTWVNHNCDTPPPCYLPARNRLTANEIDNSLVAKITSLGLGTSKDIIKKIENAENCEVVAIYHLLLERESEKIHSICEPNESEFVSTLETIEEEDEEYEMGDKEGVSPISLSCQIPSNDISIGSPPRSPSCSPPRSLACSPPFSPPTSLPTSPPISPPKSRFVAPPLSLPQSPSRSKPKRRESFLGHWSPKLGRKEPLVTEISNIEKSSVTNSPSRGSSRRRRSLQEIFNLPEISSSHSTIPSKALMANHTPAAASATIVPSTPIVALAIPSTPVVNTMMTPRSAKQAKPESGENPKETFGSKRRSSLAAIFGLSAIPTISESKLNSTVRSFAASMFNVSTSSSRSPTELAALIQVALKANPKITYSIRAGGYEFKCKYREGDAVLGSFCILVCKINKLSLYGIRSYHFTGQDRWKLMEICRDLVASLHL